MSIKFYEDTKTFKLDSKGTSYLFRIFEGDFLVHLHFGGAIPDTAVQDMYLRAAPSASNPPSPDVKHYTFSPGVSPTEYSSNGAGDFRMSSVSILNPDGNTVTDFRYESHSILKGKPALDGIPSLYDDDNECETLSLILKDRTTGAVAELLYTVFENHSAITRSVKIKNPTDKAFDIEKVMSMNLDLPCEDLDMLTLYGRPNEERYICSEPLRKGISAIQSTRGSSSHFHNPFVALKKKDASEDFGEVYGFNLAYSGNFLMAAETDIYGYARFIAGINPENFNWHLEPDESFQAPEVIMVYSNEGLGGMSRTYHSLYRKHLLPRNWKGVKKPLLINSWEAAFFDFNTEKLLNFAAAAKELGIEMLVMDDGWFGVRNSDNCSLGDWFVNEEKLPGGLAPLVDGVHALGMKFGIWFEPEMISPNSDLFRAHPDWYLHVPNRQSALGRNQYVLDMSRDDVVDNIWEQMYAIFSKHDIDYIKWDFNRNLTEVGSALLPASKQKEVFHRYILGVYKLMDRLTSTFPKLLMEGCASGGGRFDPATLSFSPQFWCSDNTDAIERMNIQYGTSLCYPLDTMGSHVSANRRTSIDTRANVAMFGTFGYELDPLKLSDEDKEKVKEQVEMYNLTHHIIVEGDFYRLVNPMENTYRCAWMSVTPDKSEALVLSAVIRYPSTPFFVLRLKGLAPEKNYKETKSGKVYSGATLMNAGLNLSYSKCTDGYSELFHFVEV